MEESWRSFTYGIEETCDTAPFAWLIVNADALRPDVARGGLVTVCHWIV